MILYQNGDNQAFEILYSRYKGRVYSYLVKRLQEYDQLEDIFQGIFIKFHKSRKLYKSEHAVSKWIFTICRSELTDYLRKKSRSVPTRGDLDLDGFQIPTPDHGEKFTQYLDNVKLSDKEIKALKLRYKEDKEFSEIGAILNIAESSSRKIISRAIKKLVSFHRRSS